MRKLYLLCVLLIVISVSAVGQNVGIGTNNPTNKLDVAGWLKLGDENTAGTAVTGTMRWSTTNSCMECYDGTSWNCITTGNGDGWLTTGNTGTNPSTNFLGTRDNQDLIFRTNNAQRMRIGTDGNVAIGADDNSNYRLYIYNNNANAEYGIRNQNYSTSNSTKYGIYNYVNNSGTGSRFGIYNLSYQNSSSSGINYGIYNYAYQYSGADADAYGLYNYVYQQSSAASENGYGIYNNAYLYGTGPKYGTRTNVYLSNNNNTNQVYAHYTYLDFDGTNDKYADYLAVNTNSTHTGTHYGYYADIYGTGNGSHYGMYNDMEATGSGVHYATYNSIEGSGTGTKYAVYNSMTGTGSAPTYANYSTYSGTHAGTFYGSYSNIAGSGNGTKYGDYNNFTNSGTGTKYGNYNYFNNGDGTTYGMYNYWPSSSGNTDTKYGIRQAIYGTGGTIYGVYNYISNTSTSTFYGIYSAMYGSGASGTKYAGYFYNGTSTNSSKYGVYASASSTGSGTHYGVYAYGYGAGDYGVYGTNTHSSGWAGYFTGRGYFSDYLGVGVNNPERRFHVQDNSNTTAASMLVSNTNTGTNADATLNFRTANSGTNDFSIGINNSMSRDMQFCEANWVGSTIRMTIEKSTGRVGINTTAPTANLDVNGTVDATVKSFKIDHPSDPANKTLRHYSIESDKGLLIYSGKATLNANGEATVQMQDFYTDLVDENNATVHLTVEGRTPFLTSYEWNGTNNSFTIFGNAGGKVSWQVNVERDDPTYNYRKQPLVMRKGVDVEMPAGKYVDPEAHGKTFKEGMSYWQDEIDAHNAVINTEREEVFEAELAPAQEVPEEAENQRHQRMTDRDAANIQKDAEHRARVDAYQDADHKKAEENEEDLTDGPNPQEQ